MVWLPVRSCVQPPEVGLCFHVALSATVASRRAVRVPVTKNVFLPIQFIRGFSYLLNSKCKIVTIAAFVADLIGVAVAREVRAVVKVTERACDRSG